MKNDDLWKSLRSVILLLTGSRFFRFTARLSRLRRAALKTPRPQSLFFFSLSVEKPESERPPPCGQDRTGQIGLRL
jgi:hypothetical protein